VLLADADGVIVETLGEPGQVVAAGQIVIRLAHTGPREATVNLPEAIRPAIGSKASATVYGDHGSRFPALLRQLSGTADPVSRTYEARYVLEGAAGDLFQSSEHPSGCSGGIDHQWAPPTLDGARAR